MLIYRRKDGRGEAQYIKKYEPSGRTRHGILFLKNICRGICFEWTEEGAASRKGSLEITEMDNTAREIFMAAQNRAVLLSGGRRLNALLNITRI